MVVLRPPIGMATLSRKQNNLSQPIAQIINFTKWETTIADIF
jgi:hypothetical protein